MSYSFIPSLHYENSESKLTPAWCKKVKTFYYDHTKNRHLLDKKNVDEILQYATGNIDMKPYMRMYKSIKDTMEGPNKLSTSRDITKQMQFEPLPMIPAKINSAISQIQKIPIEISCKAIDALAIKKKKEDIEFLKNKPAIEEDLQPLADQLGIGKVDLGTSKYSSVPFSDSPYGLDLNEPDELQIFVDLLYSLSVESSFETILQIFNEVKNVVQFRYLQTRDQYYYGVSSQRAYESAITGLPEIEYDFPGSIYVPHSDLPDFGDRTHEYKEMNPTVMEMFNLFQEEIGSEEKLFKIINEEKFGYCAACGIKGGVEARNFNTFKVNLIHFAVKSVDWVGVKKVADTDDEWEITFDEKEVSYKMYGQNTYTFFWLKGTNHFFKIDKLGFATRKKGQESFQGFERSIYKSQEQSAVELSIPQNRMAQVAFIKMQHAVIRALPDGKVIDLKGLRSAMESLEDEQNSYTMMELINLAIEENIMIIDTEGFEGKNDGQLKPFYDIPGGIKGGTAQYENVIIAADNRISQFTGINQQLTGASANPEGLIGLQKLLINSSLNSLNYVNQAITTQYQKLFNVWAYIIKNGIEKYPEVKKAIINMIGSQKVSVLDGLSELPLHTMGIQIGFTQREEEKADLKARIARLVERGVLTMTDEYMLEAVQNPKDKFGILAVKEKQFLKRAAQERQEQYENQQQLMQQQGANQVESNKAKADGEIQKVYAKGDVESKLKVLGRDMAISERQMDGLIKRQLQQDRGIDQSNKERIKIEGKKEVEQTKPLI